MFSIGFVSIVAFLIALISTRLVRDASVRLGLVDLPDNRRKMHKVPVPRTGGIAIAVAYLLAFVFLLWSPFSGGVLLHSGFPVIWRLLPAMVAIFAIGLVDDIFNLGPWWKLAGQIAAATLAYTGGVRIAEFSGSVHFGWASLPLTVSWLVLCANSFNLIDGMDGLATGVGVLAALTALIDALMHGNMALALAIAPLIGAMLGFLRYNFNPASIFLGDSGSLLIGFLLGAYGIIWGQKSTTLLGMAAPTMALALPFIEVGLSVFRRFLRNEPIFAADRGHIHHRLLDRGFTPRRAVLLLYGVCGIGATLSILHDVLHNLAGAVVLLFAACACFGIQYLGYVEFDATRRFLWGGLRPMLSAHVKLESFERSLTMAGTLDACWEAITTAAQSLGYSQVDARLAGRCFGAMPFPRSGAAFWQMRLNLPNRDFVNITQREDAAEQPLLVIAFAEVVRRVLPARIEELATASESLANLATALDPCPTPAPLQAAPRNSRTRTVISSDCGAPSVNPLTAS